MVRVSNPFSSSVRTTWEVIMISMRAWRDRVAWLTNFSVCSSQATLASSTNCTWVMPKGASAQRMWCCQRLVSCQSKKPGLSFACSKRESFTGLFLSSRNVHTHGASQVLKIRARHREVAKAKTRSPMLFIRQKCQIFQHLLDGNRATGKIANAMTERLKTIRERHLVRSFRRNLPNGRKCLQGSARWIACARRIVDEPVPLMHASSGSTLPVVELGNAQLNPSLYMLMRDNAYPEPSLSHGCPPQQSEPDERRF